MFTWDNVGNKKELDYKSVIKEAFIFFSQYDEFIFKGASLLELINTEKVESFGLSRRTKDVDITNLNMTKNNLKQITKEFIEILCNKYDLSNYTIEEAPKTRESDIFYTVNFIDRTGSIVFNIDFSKDKYYNQDRHYNIYGIMVCWYDINKIVCDKLSTISTRKIFSRIKDFIDIYNITLNNKYTIDTDIIRNYLQYKVNDGMGDINNGSLGDFRQIVEMKDNIYKAVTKMQG